MLQKLFGKKSFTIENFIEELFRENLNTKWIEEALETKSIDINYQDKSGDTFLMMCLKKKRYDVASWLLEKNADPSIKNNEYKTAIDIAIEKNKLQIVEELLKHPKLDINQKDNYGRSLLQNMVVSGNLSMAKTLIKNGANINALDGKKRHIMYDALSYGDHSFVEYLLSLKNIELNDIDDDGNTLMQHPQIEQNDLLAKDLLIAGCNPTVLNSKGESYLFKTALRGKEAEPIIEVALIHGANVNEKTLSNNTIMMELFLKATQFEKKDEAKKQSVLRTIKKMLHHRGDINALDAKGESGLFTAVKLRSMEFINFLIDSGIDPNIQNHQGETVLEYLVYDDMKYADILKTLLSYGIDPKLKNKKGQSAFEILTNIILHINGNNPLTDDKLIALIDPDGLYLQVVRLLLENEKSQVEDDKFILEVYDSHGDPLFFKPLMKDTFSLFSVYTKYPINLHMLNKQGHNIFYAYVLKTFEDNISNILVCKSFQNNISSLISRKVNQNFKDALGWTVLHKITSTPCDPKLFDILTKTVRFDYSVADNLGRTVIHNAVWGNKPDVIRLVHKVSPETINLIDIYHIPPLYYAALLGSQSLVLQFLDLGALVTTSKKIDAKAIKKFSPMLKNLEKLTEKVTDLTKLKKFQSVIEQVQGKFLPK